jgi:hypothetical protein
MKARTLVTQRLYFGMDALNLRAATGRVLSRVVGLPPERARVNLRSLRQDFGVDTVQGNMLVEQFVADGMLQPPGKLQVDYGLTERFLEFASARVVEPLPRERARQLLAHACELAARVNSEWTRNPLEIEAVAPFGCYMSRDRQLSELPLGIVVRPRPATLRARWGRIHTKSDGAREIRAEFRELSSFILVRMVNDTRRLPRPFAVAFHADSPALVASLSSHPA